MIEVNPTNQTFRERLEQSMDRFFSSTNKKDDLSQYYDHIHQLYSDSASISTNSVIFQIVEIYKRKLLEGFSSTGKNDLNPKAELLRNFMVFITKYVNDHSMNVFAYEMFAECLLILRGDYLKRKIVKKVSGSTYSLKKSLSLFELMKFCGKLFYEDEKKKKERREEEEEKEEEEEEEEDEGETSSSDEDKEENICKNFYIKFLKNFEEKTNNNGVLKMFESIKSLFKEERERILKINNISSSQYKSFRDESMGEWKILFRIYGIDEVSENDIKETELSYDFIKNSFIEYGLKNRESSHDDRIKSSGYFVDDVKEIEKKHGSDSESVYLLDKIIKLVLEETEGEDTYILYLYIKEKYLNSCDSFKILKHEGIARCPLKIQVIIESLEHLDKEVGIKEVISLRSFLNGGSVQRYANKREKVLERIRENIPHYDFIGSPNPYKNDLRKELIFTYFRKSVDFQIPLKILEVMILHPLYTLDSFLEFLEICREMRKIKTTESFLSSLRVKIFTFFLVKINKNLDSDLLLVKAENILFELCGYREKENETELFREVYLIVVEIVLISWNEEYGKKSNNADFSFVDQYKSLHNVLEKILQFSHDNYSRFVYQVFMKALEYCNPLFEHMFRKMMLDFKKLGQVNLIKTMRSLINKSNEIKGSGSFLEGWDSVYNGSCKEYRDKYETILEDRDNGWLGFAWKYFNREDPKRIELQNLGDNRQIWNEMFRENHFTVFGEEKIQGMWDKKDEKDDKLDLLEKKNRKIEERNREIIRRQPWGIFVVDEILENDSKIEEENLRKLRRTIKEKDWKFDEHVLPGPVLGSGSSAVTYLCWLIDVPGYFVFKIYKRGVDQETMAKKDTFADIPYQRNVVSILCHLEDQDIDLTKLRDSEKYWPGESSLEGQHIIVMKFHEHTLDSYLKRRVESLESGKEFNINEKWNRVLNMEVCRMAKGLLLAVLHLKNEFVVHRDLYSENVFVNPRAGRIWIGDFGLNINVRNNGDENSRFRVHKNSPMLAGSYSGENSYGGKNSILPPEVLKAKIKEEDFNVDEDEKFVDYSKCDLFSVGVLLYEIVSSLFGNGECFPFGFKKEDGEMKTKLPKLKNGEECVGFDETFRNRVDEDLIKLIMNILILDINQRISHEKAVEEIERIEKKYQKKE